MESAHKNNGFVLSGQENILRYIHNTPESRHCGKIRYLMLLFPHFGLKQHLRPDTQDYRITDHPAAGRIGDVLDARADTQPGGELGIVIDLQSTFAVFMVRHRRLVAEKALGEAHAQDIVVPTLEEALVLKAYTPEVGYVVCSAVGVAVSAENLPARRCVLRPP